MGYPDASMARGDGPASQAFDPLEMLESAAGLANPIAAARQMPWLADGGSRDSGPLGRDQRPPAPGIPAVDTR